MLMSEYEFMVIRHLEERIGRKRESLSWAFGESRRSRRENRSRRGGLFGGWFRLFRGKPAGEDGKGRLAP